MTTITSETMKSVLGALSTMPATSTVNQLRDVIWSHYITSPAFMDGYATYLSRVVVAMSDYHLAKGVDMGDEKRDLLLRVLSTPSDDTIRRAATRLRKLAI